MHKRFLGILLLAGLLLAVSPSARADNDNVHFFNDIHVPAGATVQDAVCFFCSLDADGEVNGSAVVFFGSVRLGSDVHSDVVNFFGSTTARDNVTIDGDLVNFFGSVRLGENARVGGDMVSMFGGTHLASTATVRGDKVQFPFVVFGVPAVVLGLLIYAIVAAVRERRYRAYAAQYPSPPRA